MYQVAVDRASLRKPPTYARGPWITALHEFSDGQAIAIEGKPLSRSVDAADSNAAFTC